MTDDFTEATKERIEILRGLYPLYKEEVYCRREQMMRITALGSAFLLLLLLAKVWGTPHPLDDTMALLASTGMTIFWSILVYLILQQRDRHHMAKQSLIEIERALGLYEEGFYLDHKTLYPKDWQTAWLSDRSVTAYIAVITTLTILVIAAILLRSST
ncbi:MAG: hypothetical protein VST68_02725 [Nitrospirota bacterium]|nr:hypothetical protein [Nitrospirota bacterium]